MRKAIGPVIPVGDVGSAVYRDLRFHSKCGNPRGESPSGIGSGAGDGSRQHPVSTLSRPASLTRGFALATKNSPWPCPGSNPKGILAHWNAASSSTMRSAIFSAGM